MADKVVNTSTSVSSVLNDSKVKTSSSLMLSYTKDIREFTQEAALEQMVTNEHLDSMSKSVKAMTVTLEKGFKGFANAFTASFNAMLPMIRRDDLEERDERDVTPNKQLALTHSSTVMNAATERDKDRDRLEEEQFWGQMKAFSEDTRNSTGEIAFYMRTVIRDLEYFKNNGMGRDVTPPRSSDDSKKKPSKEQFGDGLFDWLLDILGLSGEVAAVTGFFKKFKGRFRNTLGKAGQALDNAFGFITRTFGKFFGGLAKVVGTISKKIGLDKLIDNIIGRATKIGSKMFSSIGTMFGSMVTKFTKAFPRLSGVLGKVGGFVANTVGKLTGFAGGILKKVGGKALAKAGGLTAAKAVPVIGQIFAAVMAIKDAGDALKDSKRITGKSKEFLTLGDKVNVGLSGIISAFTLGLVDTKTIYKWVSSAQTAIGGALTALFNMFPAPFKKVMTSIWDALFDKKTGIFGGVLNMFEGILDKLGNGQWGSALWDAILLVPKGIINVLGKLGSKFMEFIKGDGASGVMDSVWEMMKSMFVAIKDWAVQAVKDFAKNPKQSLLSLWDKLTDENSSKREAAVETVSQKTEQINEFLRQGNKKAAQAAYKDLQSFTANNSMAGDEGFQQATAQQLNDAKMAMSSGKPVQMGSSVDTAQAMDDSKARLDAQTKKMGDVSVTPIINVPPMPAEKPKIVRRTEAADQTIAMANLGL